MKLVQYPLVSNMSDGVVPVETLEGVVTTKRNSERDLQELG